MWVNPLQHALDVKSNKKIPLVREQSEENKN